MFFLGGYPILGEGRKRSLFGRVEGDSPVFDLVWEYVTRPLQKSSTKIPDFLKKSGIYIYI